MHAYDTLCINYIILLCYDYCYLWLQRNLFFFVFLNYFILLNNLLLLLLSSLLSLLLLLLLLLLLFVFKNYVRYHKLILQILK